MAECKTVEIRIKLTNEITVTKTTFLDTKVYKVNRLFHREAILDACTYYKPTETYQASRKASSKEKRQDFQEQILPIYFGVKT